MSASKYFTGQRYGEKSSALPNHKISYLGINYLSARFDKNNNNTTHITLPNLETVICFLQNNNRLTHCEILCKYLGVYV